MQVTLDPDQHPDCSDNIHWVPPWFDIDWHPDFRDPLDPQTVNLHLIIDSSTKLSLYELWIKHIGEEELQRRVKAYAANRRSAAARDLHGHSHSYQGE